MVDELSSIGHTSWAANVLAAVFSCRISCLTIAMPQIDPPLDDKVLVALQRSPHLHGRHLRFETESGRVTLRGVVRSYFQKQIAQEVVRRVDGVDEIRNELEVTSA